MYIYFIYIYSKDFEKPLKNLCTYLFTSLLYVTFTTA